MNVYSALWLYLCLFKHKLTLQIDCYGRYGWKYYIYMYNIYFIHFFYIILYLYIYIYKIVRCYLLILWGFCWIVEEIEETRVLYEYCYTYCQVEDFWVSYNLLLLHQSIKIRQGIRKENYWKQQQHRVANTLSNFFAYTYILQKSDIILHHSERYYLKFTEGSVCTAAVLTSAPSHRIHFLFNTYVYIYQSSLVCYNSSSASNNMFNWDLFCFI